MKWSVFFIALMLPLRLTPLIYKLDSFVTPDNKQLVICASSVHRPSVHPAGGEIQKQEILKILKQYPTVMIAEDQFSFRPMPKVVQQRIKKIYANFAEDEALHGVFQDCKKLDIPVQSVDHRFVFDPGEDKLQLSKAMTYFDKVVNTVQSYNDGAVANRYYKENTDAILTRNNRLLSTMRATSHTPVTFIDVIQEKFGLASAQDFETKFARFDTELIDCQALHGVLATPQPIKFVWLGGAHVKRMLPVFAQLGFKHQYSFNTPELRNKENKILDNPLAVPAALQAMVTRNEQAQVIEQPRALALVPSGKKIKTQARPTKSNVYHLHMNVLPGEYKPADSNNKRKA